MLNELKIKYTKEEALRHSFCPPNCCIGFDIITVVIGKGTINFIDTESLVLSEIKSDVNFWGLNNVMRLPSNYFLKDGLYQILCEYFYSHDGPIRLTVLAQQSVDIYANLLKAKQISCFNHFKEQLHSFASGKTAVYSHI